MQPACIRKGLHDNPRVKLLFDFGHLNVTAQTFGLKWSYECESLLDEFIPRIAEIHLSENSGSGDEHLPITSNSLQLAMIKKYRKQLKEHNVKLTIEARSATFDELAVSYDLVKNKLEE
jgi:sugar phosphate isomerase/epimerase